MGQGFSPILNEVNIPVMLKEICSSPLFYGSKIMPGMICAARDAKIPVRSVFKNKTKNNFV